jgi:hypothetical protein
LIEASVTAQRNLYLRRSLVFLAVAVMVSATTLVYYRLQRGGTSPLAQSATREIESCAEAFDQAGVAVREWSHSYSEAKSLRVDVSTQGHMTWAGSEMWAGFHSIKDVDPIAACYLYAHVLRPDGGSVEAETGAIVWCLAEHTEYQVELLRRLTACGIDDLSVVSHRSAVVSAALNLRSSHSRYYGTSRTR